MENLFFKAFAARDAGAEVGGPIVDADLTQRAVAPVECAGFRLARLRERVGLMFGDEHFFRAQAFTEGRVHDSPTSCLRVRRTRAWAIGTL